METTNVKLIDLKKDAEALNQSINSLLSEAVSYKNATKSMLDVAGNLNAAADKTFKLSDKASEIIEVLSRMDQKVITDIKAEVDIISKEVSAVKADTISSLKVEESIVDRLKAFEKNQESTFYMFKNMIESSKSETTAVIRKMRNLLIVLSGISIILLLVILFLR